MREASVLKALGYFTSTVSVLLLGFVALKSAMQEPLLFACLLLGMATSIAGMFLRWRSHRVEQKQKDAEQAELETRASSGGALRSAP